MGSVKMSSTMFVLRLAGTLAMGLGGIVLVGLSFNITALGHILPGWTFVKPNAALAFFLSGIALFFYLSSSVTLVRVARLCGCLSGLIGVLTLTEYVTGWNSGLEQWLVRESAGTVVDWLRVRMAPDTALCFVLLAVGLELSRFARRRWMVIASAVLGVLVTALALVNVMSYFTPNLRTYAWGAVPMMAFLTAVMFALLGLALIWAVSRERLPGLTSPLTPLWFSMLLLAFLLLAVAIISAGIFYYRNYSKSCRMEVERDLSAVVALKADQLEQWRKERKGDADFLFQNGPVSALIRRFLEKPEDRDAEREIKLWMGKYLKSYGYDGVQLLDTQGVTRISSPFGLPAVSSLSAEELSGVLRAGQPVFKDFYRDTCDHRVYLGILVPILDERDASQRLGVLFLRINPETYIYPSLKFWPRPSRTAETVLVRRQGHEVVVLNELRAHTNAALNLTLSLGRIEFSEGQAALEREGVWEIVKKRWEPVVSEFSQIEDSERSVVVSMSIAER